MAVLAEQGRLSASHLPDRKRETALLASSKTTQLSANTKGEETDEKTSQTETRDRTKAELT